MKKTEISKEGYIVHADTGEKVVHYECDPLKNSDCRKTNCKPLGRGDQRCNITLNSEARATGGKSFYIRSIPGARVEFEREYIREPGE